MEAPAGSAHQQQPAATVAAASEDIDAVSKGKGRGKGNKGSKGSGNKGAGSGRGRAGKGVDWKRPSCSGSRIAEWRRVGKRMELDRQTDRWPDGMGLEPKRLR